ncbi:MAG: EAL domain-containing protein [Betaproteobacteria bacterium]
MTSKRILGERNRHVTAIIDALADMSPETRARLGDAMPAADPSVTQTAIVALQIDLAATTSALRELEAQHRALVELSSDWYWEHDEQQRFTRISEQMLEKTGIRVRDMIGRTRWDFDARCDAEVRVRLDADMEAHRPFYDVRLDRLTADGTVRNLSISGAPMFDAAGRYIGYRGIGKDITERRRDQAAARESQVFARAALDSLADLVCVIDRDGKIIEVNAAWRQFATTRSAVASSAFMGANYIDACERASGYERADGAAVAGGLRALLAGTRDTFRHEYMTDARIDARWFVLKATRFEMLDGTHVVVAHEEITERKSAERGLVLEQRVARCLADGEETAPALCEVIRAVSESQRWACGMFLGEDDAGPGLAIGPSWAASAAEREAAHAAASDAAHCADGGFIAEARRSGQTRWVEDLAALAPMSAHAGGHADLRCAIAVPVIADAAPLGMMVFFGSQVRALDHVVEGTMRVVAAQVSQFLKRRRAEAALRESEARFRSLSDLSADWYWQQDADLRFTSMCNGAEIDAGLAEDADCGKTRWELSGAGEAQWSVHREVTHAHLPFLDFEMKRAFPDGSVRDICISGTPIFDDAGHFTGYRGIGRDNTRRKQEVAVLALEHKVSSCIAASGESTSVVETVIHAICEFQRWSWGGYFHFDQAAGALRVDAAWANPNELAAPVIVALRTLAVAPGEGIAGRVWASGQPVRDIEPASDPRVATAAAAAGFQSGFGFPCIADGRTVGVLQFMSRDAHELDERLLSAMRTIGNQLGQYLQRRRADGQRQLQSMLLNTVGDAVMASDVEETISYWNAAAQQLYGWTAAEAIGRKMLDMVRPASHAHVSGALRAVNDGRIWRGEKVGHRRDGSTFPAHLTLAPVQDAQGEIVGVVSVSRDISEFKHAEQVIRAGARQQGLIAAFGQRALANAQLDTLLEDATATVVDGLETPFCRILELAPDGHSLVSRTARGFGEASHGRHAIENVADTPEHRVVTSQLPVVVDDYTTDQGFAIPVDLAQHGIHSGACVIIGGANGPFGVLAAHAREVAHFSVDGVNFLQSVANTLTTAIDRIAADELVAYLAQFDALTGLPNRSLFRDRLAMALTYAQRNASNVGVMFVDLDRFKDVNDTYGHVSGDQVLAAVGERLRLCVRGGDTVGRLGGDEFAIVLSNLARADDANLVAQQIVDAMARPFDVDGHDVILTASIGIAVYPSDGEDPTTLLRNADAAMYLAKEQGRNGFHFYTEAINARVTRRKEIESELRHAIANDEFVLHYQPEVAAASGRIVGVEALIRWQHPVRGLLAPAEFIAVAEETGLIVPIGRWVATNACAQLAHWHRLGHGELIVAINVSPLEIRRGNVVDSIREALEKSQLDARHLEVELTESLLMDGADSFIRALEALQTTGVSIAIDDFGTGYSNLSYLKRFPVDKVKIDRMFIRDIVSSEDDAAIVQAIVAMSHHLKLQVTAEGVETDEQAAFLRRCRCDILQGYWFGAPVPAMQMEVLLARDRDALARK